MNAIFNAAISKTDTTSLIERFLQCRKKSVAICFPLEIEDYVVQPSPEVSPPKWHLAHTSWFFEEVILKKYQADFQYFNAGYVSLFNSYYKTIGAHTLQAERGHLSRPTVAELMQYRQHIDAEITKLLNEISCANLSFNPMVDLIETAIHHEQQHQELLYMDIKFILASNALPTEFCQLALPKAPSPVFNWQNFDEGLYAIGQNFDAPHSHFCYDNEAPQHKHYLYPFAIRQSLVTNGEYLAFIEDDGYQKAAHWLSQGWDWVKQHNITQPLYWQKMDGVWFEYTLHGQWPLDLDQPVVHISYFEASAFAKWQRLRLPTEQEFEVFLTANHAPRNTHNQHILHPTNAHILTGQVWCWTASQYSPYPRFKAFDGLLHEYNGKFMCNQFVLKGGCVATPNQHYRHTYRNFYQPQQRWQFSGIRLAKDII